LWSKKKKGEAGRGGQIAEEEVGTRKGGKRSVGDMPIGGLTN